MFHELCTCDDQAKSAIISDEKYMDFIYEMTKAAGYKCVFVKMDQVMPVVHQSFAMKKNNPFTGIMKYRLVGILLTSYPHNIINVFLIKAPMLRPFRFHAPHFLFKFAGNFKTSSLIL